MRLAAFSITAMSLAVLVVNDAALAQERMYPQHMMWGGGWFMGPIMMLIFVAIVVFVIVLLVRWLWPAGSAAGTGAKPTSAINILEERFARGEIDREEFEEKKRVLGN